MFRNRCVLERASYILTAKLGIVRYFRPIINFLRTREIVLDKGISPEGVRLEAEYFMVNKLFYDFSFLCR